MYPLCCIDIRNFLNQFYFFSDDHFQHPTVIDETLRKVSYIFWQMAAYLHTMLLVSGRTSYRKGLQVARRASKFPVSGPDRPNSHQPRAFRNRLSRARATTYSGAFIDLSRRSRHTQGYRLVPWQQEDGWKANFRTCQLKDWRLNRHSRIRMVCHVNKPIKQY